MSVAHVLVDLSVERAQRLDAMLRVLQELRLAPIAYTAAHVKAEIAENLETQLGARNGARSAYAQLALGLLSKQVKPGDLIIATEAWHGQLVFRGLLDANQGKYAGVPVVELWVDYPGSFARHRAFTSNYAIAFAAGERAGRGIQAPTGEWIVTPPLLEEKNPLPAKTAPLVLTPADNAFQLDFLRWSLSNQFVIAPDTGVWREKLKQGVTGVLYRTEAGRINAVNRIVPGLEDKKQAIAGHYLGQYTLQAACAGLKAFLERVQHA